MNNDDMLPLPDRSAGEIYGKDKQKNVALPTTADAERYSQHSAPGERSSVMPQPATPLSQSLLHASSASLAMPREAQRVDAPPTTLRKHSRERSVARYLLISLATLALTVFACLFAFHQFGDQNTPHPVNKDATKQAVAELATSNVNKAAALSSLMTQTAVASVPYHITVPGPCNNIPGWSAQPQDAPSYMVQCLATSVRLAYQVQPPLYVGVTFMTEAVYPNVIFQYIDLKMTVLDLTLGSCLSIYSSPQTKTFTFCHDGAWTFLGGNQNMTGTYHANNPNTFLLHVRLDQSNEQYFIDNTLIDSFPHFYTANMGATDITYQLAPENNERLTDGSVNLSNFSLTPLP